jgi:hypothetical protein
MARRCVSPTMLAAACAGAGAVLGDDSAEAIEPAERSPESMAELGKARGLLSELLSEPDRLDQLGARLFKAARDEPLPAGAMARALSVARAEQGRHANAKRSGRSVKLALWGSAAALAAGITIFAGHRAHTDPISAEPPSLSTHATPLSPASVRALSATPTAAVATPAPNLAPPASARSASVSLSDELGALKLASRALESGDTHAALSALDRYDRVLKGTKMRAEATLLRIEALSKAGQTAASSTLAKQFVAQNPESPHVDRARSFVRH